VCNCSWRSYYRKRRSFLGLAAAAVAVAVVAAATLLGQPALEIDSYGPVMEQTLEMVLSLDQPSRLGILWLY
jgi:hypothetical protein